MPLVTTNEMLKKAQAGHYAVGAFNVENMEMVMAVIKAAEEMNSPVIMQTCPNHQGCPSDIPLDRQFPDA